MAMVHSEARVAAAQTRTSTPGADSRPVLLSLGWRSNRLEAVNPGLEAVDLDVGLMDLMSCIVMEPVQLVSLLDRGDKGWESLLHELDFFRVPSGRHQRLQPLDLLGSQALRTAHLFPADATPRSPGLGAATSAPHR